MSERAFISEDKPQYKADSHSHTTVSDGHNPGLFGEFRGSHALEAGNHYAAQAPVIDSLTVEDGRVRTKSKNAKYFVMLTEYRSAKMVSAPLHEYLSEAGSDIPDGDGHLRSEVFDAYGRRACTRAYFRDEWE